MEAKSTRNKTTAWCLQDEAERPMSPTTISDNISVTNLPSCKESVPPQSPVGEKEAVDPGDLAAALLDPPDETLDTVSVKSVAGESCV